MIFQEYGDKEIGRSAGNIFYDNVRSRLIDACSPDDQLIDDKTNEDQPVNRVMEWKQFRPSILSTLWNSVYFGFLISLLSAVLIGAFSILVYYFNYQVILVCLARSKESIPVKIQWSKTAFESTEAVFIHLSFFVNTLFYFKSYQILFRRFLRSLSRCSSGPWYFLFQFNACAKYPWKRHIFI